MTVATTASNDADLALDTVIFLEPLAQVVVSVAGSGTESMVSALCHLLTGVQPVVANLDFRTIRVMDVGLQDEIPPAFATRCWHDSSSRSEVSLRSNGGIAAKWLKCLSIIPQKLQKSNFKQMGYDGIMQVDPRLNDIDNCLYRVAIRVLIVQNNKVLLVKEASDDWWALPGGGVDHGESVESSLVREVEEELGVPAKAVSSDFQIVHYNIGNVVNAVPRMNLFFKASVPEGLLKQTTHVAAWQWFTRDEFLKAEMNASYDKAKLTDVIFGA